MFAIGGKAHPLPYVRMQIVHACNQILTYRL